MLELDRRTFLTSAGASLFGLLSRHASANIKRTDALLAAACRFADGQYGAVLMDEAANIILTIDLPARGHDVIFDRAAARGVVFARRPGSFAVVFNTESKTEPMLFSAPMGRHFYGHGAFSADGKLLFASENDYAKATGKIGIYDTTDKFTRIGEFDSFGIGPHEIALMPDGKTLAVCNGGIQTHPTMGRAKLNLPTMRPNLAFVETSTGALIELHELGPDYSQLSIRHMAVANNSKLVFGCQHQGKDHDQMPLVGTVSLGEIIKLYDLAPETLGRFAGYVGSVATSGDGKYFSVSSPKGNTVGVFNARSGQTIRMQTMVQACGLAWPPHGLQVSSHKGAIGEMGAMAQSGVHFDNHLASA